jgi:hypothetical protein
MAQDASNHRRLANRRPAPVPGNDMRLVSIGATELDDVVVVRLGPTFEVLATNTLAGQTFIASPAIANGEIYLRGQNTLFAVR